MKPLWEQTPSCRQARGAGDGLPMEKSIGSGFNLHQALFIRFPSCPCTILFSSCAPSPLISSPRPALFHCVSLHTFGRCIHYFVSLFTYLPSLVPFFAHCLGCTISALFSSNSPPLAKGLPLQGQTLSSETWFPGTEIMESVLGCIQGRPERGVEHGNISRFLCWKHSAVVLN